MAPDLAGTRILVVEDDYLVALGMIADLRDLGCIVDGPYPSSQEAIEALTRCPVDCALLDVNVRHGTSEGIARELCRRGVPYAFVSGYQHLDLLAKELTGVPQLSKPVVAGSLRRVLALMLSRDGPPVAAS